MVGFTALKWILASGDLNLAATKSSVGIILFVPREMEAKKGRGSENDAAIEIVVNSFPMMISTLETKQRTTPNDRAHEAANHFTIIFATAAAAVL